MSPKEMFISLTHHGLMTPYGILGKTGSVSK